MHACLTHVCRMEFPTVINWNSPFLFYWMLGGISHFYSNFNRTFCKKAVETLIRCRRMRRRVWVCTVCLYLTKRTLGLYGLTHLSLAYFSRDKDKQCRSRWSRSSLITYILLYSNLNTSVKYRITTLYSEIDASD